MLQRVDQVEQAEIDAAWDEGIDRRVDEIMTGKVALVDGEETITIARARLAERRK